MSAPGDWSLRVALDTTILTVAEGAEGHARRLAATELLLKLPRDSTIVPAQALGELALVLVRNLGRSPESARDAVVGWHNTFPVIGTSPEILLAAADLFATRPVSLWEAVILSAAIAANCRLLLSLNFTDGFNLNGLTVVDPFAEPRHELIELLLNASDR
jgi:predicted nucleic acid-binding protein